MRISEMADTENNWERDVIEKFAFEALKERRRARRWGIFFKLLTFAYVTVLLLAFIDWDSGTEALGGARHTALVELTGVIEARSDASAERINAALQTAFKDKNTQGVVLRINSPGGSPVQAGIIYDEIRRLRALHPGIPFYAVIEDICASGGYYIASAADRIYVDKASIVGSIGAIMNGWGFTGLMQKTGVERRVIAAGENKDFLDPFLPLNDQHKQYAQALVSEVHQQFIDVVRKGRGNRLKESPELFSGLIWTGTKSVELGLADELGSVDRVAREVIKAEHVVDYTQKQNIVERFARRFGAASAQALVKMLGAPGLEIR
jgi:protease-4